MKMLEYGHCLIFKRSDIVTVVKTCEQAKV